jgi:Tol biopolymer transport system component
LSIATFMWLECPEIQMSMPVPGHVLVTTTSKENPEESRTCLISQSSTSSIPLPTLGQSSHVSWGPNTDELFISFCNPGRGAHTRCPVALTAIDGRIIRTYPEDSAPAFVEPDGRWSPWELTRPRPSPDGKTVALLVSGHSMLMRLSDGTLSARLPIDICESAWSPDGTRLAYISGSGPHGGCSTETQVFLYELSTGGESQLTHFGPKDYRPWWNPFAKPVVRPPLVSGLSWARRADVILFYLLPDRGVFLWNSKGEELHRLKELRGLCSRQTQLSADGQRIMYLSATQPWLCSLNGGDEIRVVNSDGSDDHVAIRLRDDQRVITAIDWWTD